MTKASSSLFWPSSPDSNAGPCNHLSHQAEKKPKFPRLKKFKICGSKYQTKTTGAAAKMAGLLYLQNQLGNCQMNRGFGIDWPRLLELLSQLTSLCSRIAAHYDQSLDFPCNPGVPDVWKTNNRGPKTLDRPLILRISSGIPNWATWCINKELVRKSAILKS